MGVAWSLTIARGVAGPYPPAAGYPGSTAIAATDPTIVQWATGDTIDRGLVNISNSTSGYASYGGLTGSPSNNAPIGMPPQPPSMNYCVALGQGGMVTLTFRQPIIDGPGADFAVFGNGFTASGSASWTKPAFVEVSSDGLNFFRFPSISLTSTASQVGSFGQLDPTDLYDLAGKDPAGYGTPFDLSELAGVSSLLNTNDVTHVRIVDCVGDLSVPYASYDSMGHIINAPWPAYSAAGSEGFCLAGVGVINALGNWTWTGTNGSTGSWNSGSNWSLATAPSGGTATVTFPDNLGAPGTVTLDGNQSAGALVFYAAGSNGYTLSQGTGGGALTLGTTGGAAIAVVGGTQSISAPIALEGDLAASASAGTCLELSGSIGQAVSASASLNLSSDGLLVLSGTNSFSGGVTVTGGKLVVLRPYSLPDGSPLTVGNAMAFAAPMVNAAVAPDVAIAVPEPGGLPLAIAIGATVFVFRRRFHLAARRRFT